MNIQQEDRQQMGGQYYLNIKDREPVNNNFITGE